jgi:hypothetical protein
MVIINRALFLRTLSRLEGTVPQMGQTSLGCATIIASSIDLSRISGYRVCLQAHRALSGCAEILSD